MWLPIVLIGAGVYMLFQRGGGGASESVADVVNTAPATNDDPSADIDTALEADKKAEAADKKKADAAAKKAAAAEKKKKAAEAKKKKKEEMNPEDGDERTNTGDDGEGGDE